MKIVAYLAVSGDEQRIHSFASTVGAGTGIVKELRKKAPTEGAGASKRWVWRTKRREIDSADVEAEIERFLEETTEIRAVIASARQDLADVYLGLIAQFNDDDSPRGFSLSARSISLLAEVDGAFEIDAVSVLDANVL